MAELLQDLTHRYPGIKPFTSREDNIFFGRDTDTENLYSLLFVKQTVVLYGKSGYGKSSLLNAGIIPKLEREGSWIYFTIRFNNYSEREQVESISPAENVRRRLSKNLGDGNSILDQLIPQENSLWYWLKTNQDILQKSQFILFFDQFEELFTYPKEQIEEFSEQLSQLLYNTVPVKFRKRLAELDENDELDDELHDFLHEKPEIKVVFSVRSDRLSLLNGLTDRHPTILQNFYELNALSRQQAAQAITDPAHLPQNLGFDTPEFGFEEGALTKILDNISNPLDGKIETATLQIVCRYIEDELVLAKQNMLITADTLGDITDIFKQYYENILSRLNDHERRLAQHLIEDELIEGGRRNPLSETYIQNKFDFSEDLLLKLEHSSLLRKERDTSGRLLYEVSHDSLVNAIEKVAQNRRIIEEDLKKLELERQVAEERRRADELQELSNRSKSRSRIAIGLAVVCILVAIFALMSENRARTMEEIARKNEVSAKEAQYEAEKQKRIALEEGYRAKILLAKRYMAEAEIFREGQNIDWALTRLNLASDLFKTNDSLSVALSEQVNPLLQELRKKTDEYQIIKNKTGI